MIRTATQNKQLHSLLGQLRYDEERKQDLVFQFTNERTFHSSEMTFHECQNLNSYLCEVKLGTRRQVGVPVDPAQKMRRKLFAIAHELRWTTDGKVDKDRLFKWVEEYGYLHKPLMKYNASEMPTLLTQFEQVLKQFYAKR